MIILEGADGSGKSTLARVLANIFKKEIYHPGGAPAREDFTRITVENLNKLEKGYICDRFSIISECVYGPIMNDRQLVDREIIFDLYSDLVDSKAVIIYCRPEGLEHMADNQTMEEHDTEEDILKLQANHVDICLSYDWILGTLATEHQHVLKNIFVYDYKKKDELKRLLDFLKEFSLGIKENRPNVNTYFSQMAKLVSTRGTCSRRKVGCVLTDNHNHVLSTGYNGRPRGFDHCSGGYPCEAANKPSGMDLDSCEAIHAEQNALLQCKDPQAIKTAYITISPCLTCIKLLLNTSCDTIVYSEEYIQTEAIKLWEKAGRNVLHIKVDT